LTIEKLRFKDRYMSYRRNREWEGVIGEIENGKWKLEKSDWC